MRGGVSARTSGLRARAERAKQNSVTCASRDLSAYVKVPGESNYGGWMQVEEGVEEVFTTRVTVHLSLTSRPEVARQLKEEDSGTPDEAINESIDETLRSIKSLCEEAAGDKSESQSAG
jgi:hypothetical protein